MVHAEIRADELERRAIWLLALGTIVLVFGTFGLFFSGDEAWKVGLFVASQAALLAAVGAVALALIPGAVPVARNFAWRREQLLSWAFMLFWLALLLTVLNVSVSAIQGIGEGGFDG